MANKGRTRMDQFEEEKKQLARSSALEARVKKDSDAMKCVVVLISLVSFFVMCCMGVAFSKNGGHVIANDHIEKTIDYEHDAWNPGSGMSEVVRCVVMLRSPGCTIELCQDMGTINCYGKIVDLSQEEVNKFVPTACESWRNETICELKINRTVFVINPKECGIVCKMLIKQ